MFVARFGLVVVFLALVVVVILILDARWNEMMGMTIEPTAR